MKNPVKKITAMLFLVFAINAASINTDINAQPVVSVSFSMFYNSLSPYGDWISDPAYGYVWVPDVGASFRPYYSNGHWVMTSYGNMWVSDYPWGWAPFHYGRWIYDGFYGWVWVPDVVWGPAWVSWRWGGGYCGWAPLSPGVSLSVSFSSYSPPYDWWVFIPPTYIYSPVFYRYYSGPSVNVMYVKRTSLVSNTYVNKGTTYIAGPRASDIERTTNQSVAVYTVKDGNKPGKSGITGNTVNVYRPDVKRTASGSERVAPAKVTKTERPVGKMQALSSNGGKTEWRSAPAKNKEQVNKASDKQNTGGVKRIQSSPEKVSTPAPDKRSDVKRTPWYNHSNQEVIERAKRKLASPPKNDRINPPVEQRNEMKRAPREIKQDLEQRQKNQRMQPAPQREPMPPKERGGKKDSH